MGTGALEVLEKCHPVAPEAVRQSRIINTAQSVIPEYFQAAVQRHWDALPHQATEAEGNAAIHALITDLESELRRRAQ